jgi:hypothetical protein
MMFMKYLFYLFNNNSPKIINLISYYFKYTYNDKHYHQIFSFEHITTPMKNNLEVFILFSRIFHQLLFI